MNYVTGEAIRSLRERKGYTQKELAQVLNVSEKTISKWETGKGLPDISLIEPLARELQVSVVELLNGEYHQNQNRSANLKKIKFYACPVCGNIIYSMGEGSYSCCGIQLPPLQPENIEQPENKRPEECDQKESTYETEDLHDIEIEKIDHEYYVTMKHPMEKQHYISFVAYVTADRIQMVKMYPQQNMETRFRICGHGNLYVFCNKHGLFVKKI